MIFNPEWHEVTPSEMELMHQLLSVDFSGRDALAEQVSQAKARWLESPGVPALQLEVSGAAPVALVTRRVPVEGRGRDIDGSDVYFLLHVVNGKANEIEIFRPDGAHIQQLPRAGTLDIMAY